MVRDPSNNFIIHTENQIFPYDPPNFQQKDAPKEKIQPFNVRFEKMAIEENTIVPEKNKIPNMAFDQNNDRKKSINLKIFSGSSNKNNRKRTSNVSMRLSQVVIDPEKEKRKSQMLNKVLAEKSLLDDLMPLLMNDHTSEKKKEQNNNATSFEGDQFFSLEQGSEVLQDLLNSDENEKGMDIVYDSPKKDPKNVDNYKLTDYSSNESSNDGSYIYEWKDVEISEEKEKSFINDDPPNKFKNLPSLQIPSQDNLYPFLHQSSYICNNPISDNEVFFSQNPMVNIFKNPPHEDHHSNIFAFKGFNFGGYTQQETVNFEKNPMKNEKRMSCLMSSPYKKGKNYEKKLFCSRKSYKKAVPTWASDMNIIKNKLLEQKSIDCNEIFGQFVVDNLDMKTLFNDDFCNYDNER